MSQCAACMHALTASLYLHRKVFHLSSTSGDATHGCLQTCWPLSSKAVVPVLCNTLVLYGNTLACAACMHALTASLYLHRKVFHLSSTSGDATHGCLQTCWPLSSKAVVPVLCNTLVLYGNTLACAACMHALTASLYLHRKVFHLSSTSGDATHGCLQTCWPLSSKAVVPVLCNTLVLYGNTLACAACMHALTASLYLHRKVFHLSSTSGDATHGCLQTCWPLSSKAVVPVLCNTLVLYGNTLACAACMHALTASLYLHRKVFHLSSTSGDATHGCLQTCWPLSSKAVVPVLCNTLVLYGNTLACAACMHALTASLYLHRKVFHLSSTSGDATHGCLQTCWPLSSKAVVPVLCNTLVLYGNTLACAACMHALTASLYLHRKVFHLSSTSGDATHGCLQTCWPLSSKAVVPVLCNTLVLYGNTLACAACMHALTASLYLHRKVFHLSSTSGDATHGCLQTCWPLSSKAVVPVLCNTLVLYGNTLACAACMHALTASLYLHRKVFHLSSGASVATFGYMVHSLLL